MLSRKLVTEFQTLYLTKYGEQITYEVAELQLQQLAELVRITSKK